MRNFLYTLAILIGTYAAPAAWAKECSFVGTYHVFKKMDGKYVAKLIQEPIVKNWNTESPYYLQLGIQLPIDTKVAKLKINYTSKANLAAQTIDLKKADNKLWATQSFETHQHIFSKLTEEASSVELVVYADDKEFCQKTIKREEAL